MLDTESLAFKMYKYLCGWFKWIHNTLRFAWYYDKIRLVEMDLLWVCVGIHLTRPSIFVAIFFARKTQIIDHFARKTAKIFYYIQPQKILKGPTFWKILSDGFLAFAPFGKKIKGFIMKILKVDTHSMPRKSFFIKKCCNDASFTT